MKASSKAVLLSTFVFPGAGQFHLKRPAIGGVIVMLALAALGVLVWHTITVSKSILAKVLSGEVQPELFELTKMISSANTPAASWATGVLVVLWVVSVVDAYLAGRHQDQQTPALSK